MLAEEDSDEEGMQAPSCSISNFPPTAVDLVMPIEVDMESASEVGMPEEEAASILSTVPKSEAGSDEELEER